VYGRTQAWLTIPPCTVAHKHSAIRAVGALTVGEVIRRVAVNQLVGAAEIAHRLGKKQTHIVHEWRKRYPDFPEPVATLTMGMVWAWSDVERWAKANGRDTQA
jgi:predicted DNA-binding transcriptional regulator AlpA